MTLIESLRQSKRPGTPQYRVTFDDIWGNSVVYSLQYADVSIGEYSKEYRETEDQKEFWAITDYWRSL